MRNKNFQINQFDGPKDIEINFSLKKGMHFFFLV